MGKLERDFIDGHQISITGAYLYHNLFLSLRSIDPK